MPRLESGPVISLVAAGLVDDEVATWASMSVTAAFGFDTEWMVPLAHPSYAYDRERAQYSSTLILRDVLTRRPPAALRVLVLTECDLFIPMLSFVYGQAQVGGPLAVVSFARLRQEFYGLAPNAPLFLLRVRKEVQHELGHTFGLTHCDDPLCTMRISTSVHQLDAKRDEFCPDCELLLHEALAEAGAEFAGSGGIT